MDREEYAYARTAARSPYVGSDYHSSCERGFVCGMGADVDLREKVWTVWMVYGIVCCSLFVVLQERHGICMVYGGCAACAALVFLDVQRREIVSGLTYTMGFQQLGDILPSSIII